MYSFNNDEKDQSKYRCIEHIYNSVDISRFKYELLEFKNELPQLLEKKYFVSENFSGANCLLVFIKIQDRYHQFLVDRKTLSYNIQKVNMSLVKLIPVNVKLDISIYKENGTILDGIFITGKDTRTFVITDVFLFKGQDMTNSHIDMKLLSIKSYLDFNYNQNNMANNIKIKVNNLVDIENVGILIRDYIPKIKDYVIKGISFYPEQSGTKLIFMFDNQSRQNSERKQFSISNQSNKELKKHYNMENNETRPYRKIETNQNIATATAQLSDIPAKNYNIYVPKAEIDESSYVFEMKKIDVDVYNLNIVEPVIVDGKKLYKRIKIGLALIPNMERSKWCQELFNDENTGFVLVHCKFHSDKQKWEPIQRAPATFRKPSDAFDFTIMKKI